MSIGIKVKLENAEKAKRLLKEKGLLNQKLRPFLKGAYVFFPIIRHSSTLTRVSEAKVNLQFRQSAEPMSMKQALAKSIPGKLKDLIPSGYDLIGDIAILEIPEELVGYQKKLAEFILATRPNVKVVLKKAGSHSGVYRRQKLTWLAGEKRKETLHRENGVLLRLNVETVYFSPRLSHERKRIAGLARPEEAVLVMFSGCGPYPMVIARNAKQVYGIEINPEAHKYAVENLKLNKVQNVKLFLGDVRKVMPRLKMKFDRIIMPLPKTGADFLDLAIPSLKKNGFLHFYDFQKESETENSEIKIINHFKQLGRKCRLLRTVLCGQHSPRVFRVCIDCQALT